MPTETARSAPQTVLDEKGQTVNWSGCTLVDGGPFQASAVGTVFDVDCSGYGGLVLSIFGTFSGQFAVVEQSIDGYNWITTNGLPISGSPTSTQAAPSQVSGTSGTVVAHVYPLYSPRVRLRVAAIASGTMSFFAALIDQRPIIWAGASGIANHGSAILGYPVRVGARARSAMLGPVTNDQASDLVTSLDGRLITLPDSIPELSWSYAGAPGGITNTAAVTLKTAGASGVRNYLRAIQYRNTSAVESEIVVRDGANGTVLWRDDLPAGAAGLQSVGFSPPLRGSAATLMEVAVLTTGTKTYINAQGFQGA